MTPERWQEVKHLYHAVLEAEPSDRGALLESADPEVRREVESLLSSEESHEGPLDRALWSEAGALLDDATQTLTQLGEGANLGQYQIQSLLGRGGMGEVYLAHDHKLGRDVAIKTLPREFSEDPERLSRFGREARVLASLNHPNIAAIYGLDESAGVNFLILELVDGETLGERLKRTGPMPVDEALRVMSQVAEALEAAHRKGITHRDIKPANIKVTPEGRIKVLDFGLAKVLGTVARAPSMKSAGAGLDTRDGRILGTPRYMSPEQARGHDVDQRTDIWAFGCVLFELLTAQPALNGKTVSDIIAAILEREPDYDELPAATPMQVRRLIQQCLVKDPGKRLPDIAEVRRAIASAQAHPRKPMITRRRLVISGAATAAAAIPVAFNIGGLRERLVGTPGPRMRSLVVLPLEDLSGDSKQEYFADGFTDALITDLSKIEGLKVISRTSAMQYKGKRKALPEVARQLQVEGVVEGTIQREGQRVVVRVNLIQASTDSSLWTEGYEGEMREALRLQARVAQAVAHEIRGTIKQQQQARLASRRVVKPEVYEDYLRGMYFLNKSAPADHDKGIEFLKAAIDKDPAEPLAYAGLSLGYSRIGHDRLPDAFQLAKAAANRALELGEEMAETYAGLAQTKLYWDWDFPGAEQDFQHALDLNPNLANARCHYSWYLVVLGRFDDAIAEMKRAKELDPLTPLYTAWLGSVYQYPGRYREMLEEARKALHLSPNYVWGLLVLGRAHQGLGLHDDAIAAYEKAVQLYPGWEWRLGEGYALAGRRSEAIEIAAEVEKKPGNKIARGLAAIYAALGDADRTIQWLETAYRERDSSMPWIGVNPAYFKLHFDPRFQNLARRVGVKLLG
jgi:serine/threonine-protein kinase